MGSLFDFHNSPIRSGVLAGMAIAVAIDFLAFALTLVGDDRGPGTDGFYYGMLGFGILAVAGLPWSLFIETGPLAPVFIFLCPLPNGAIVGFIIGSFLRERRFSAVTTLTHIREQE